MPIFTARRTERNHNDRDQHDENDQFDKCHHAGSHGRRPSRKTSGVVAAGKVHHGNNMGGIGILAIIEGLDYAPC